MGLRAALGLERGKPVVSFPRSRPSREPELIDQHRILHASNNSHGRSSEALIGDIISHAYEFFGGYGRLKTVLDFGCGHSSAVDMVAAHFKAKAHRFDPAIPEYSTIPIQRADLVVNTDVLQRIPEEDIIAFLKRLRSISKHVFFQIATEAAGTILANDENAHCTVKPDEWWLATLRQVFPDVRVVPSNWPARLTCVTWPRKIITHDEQAILALAKFSGIRGKDCVIFGSAPSPLIGDIRLEQPIICCNGSSLTLQNNLGRPPALSFVHSHVFARDNPADVEVRDALSAVKNIGRLVVLHEDYYDYDTEITRGRSEDEMRLAWGLRYSMLERLLGANLPFLDMSTGAFTVLAALSCGAKSVHLIGFSLISKGHSYNPNGRHRNHIRSDAAIYALLGQRGHRITSSDPSVSSILNPILA